MSKSRKFGPKDYALALTILRSAYRTGEEFSADDWFFVREQYRTDTKFREYVDIQTARFK